MGACLTTTHVVCDPHDPGHGSRQRSLWQASVLGQSALIVHSGLQFGGRPMKFGKHEQAGELPTTRHWEFGPQGEGTQGLPLGGCWTVGSRK